MDTIGEQQLKQMQLGSKKQASEASELLIVFTFAVYTICVKVAASAVSISFVEIVDVNPVL